MTTTDPALCPRGCGPAHRSQMTEIRCREARPWMREHRAKTGKWPKLHRGRRAEGGDKESPYLLVHREPSTRRRNDKGRAEDASS
jgi:hypothetical protein